MATGDSGSIVMELYNALKTFPFRRMVSFIRKSSSLTCKEYNNSEQSKDYWLDTRNCKHSRKVTKQCVFELFGTFSNENATDVRAGMLTVIQLDLDYYKIAGHFILGFKGIKIDQWMNVMARPDTAADELAIFALSKMYGKHTVIYNKARPCTTLDPPYPMTETELHDNCQIHLVYVGKDSYGILRRKPFIETAAPASVESMLEPMKLRKTPKNNCQSEPWDLSARHQNKHTETLTGGSSPVNNNNSKDHSLVHDEEELTPIPELGENIEVGCFGEMAVPVNHRIETDDLCYTVSEVKLYRLTNSEQEKYLGKFPTKNNPTARAKGGNNCTTSTLTMNTEQAPVAHTSHRPIPCTAYSRSGRPLRAAASRQKYVDLEDSDSDIDVADLKVDNKLPQSKPSSSGPSASRIAAQNKKTVAPEFGLKASKVYKGSESPTYSITSSGTSECYSDHNVDDDTDSNATFEGFDPLTEEQ